MKKFYSFLFCAVLAAGASAQVSIGTTTYASLKEAVAAVEDGQTIMVNENIELGDRLGTADAKSFTIEGKTADITITRKWGWKSIMFLAQGGNGCGTLTLKNLIIDSNSVYQDKTTVVEANNGKVVLDGVTVKNVESAVNVFSAKGGAYASMTLKNVSLESCTLAEGVADVFVGNPKAFTLAGTGDFSINTEKDYAVVAEDYTGKSWINRGSYAAGAVVVYGGKLANFALANAPEGYSLMEKDGNLVLDYSKMVVVNETTEVGYKSFDEALGAAADGDVLVLQEDITVAGRFHIPASITIKGASDDVKLIRNFTNNILFTIEKNKTASFENLVIDGNNKSNNKGEIEAGDGNVNMTNVKIINSTTTPTFNVKERTMTLDNVVCEDCAGIVNLGYPKSVLNLNGGCVLPNVQFKNGSTIAVVADGALTNTEAIVLAPAEGYTYEAGTVVVKNCTDVTKFALANDDWRLEASEGNLVLADKDSNGIDVIAVAEGDAVYYNLQGVQVAQPTAGMYIRVQGGKASKVLVK